MISGLDALELHPMRGRAAPRLRLSVIKPHALFSRLPVGEFFLKFQRAWGLIVFRGGLRFAGRFPDSSIPDVS